jgi:hypothetical protein
MFLAEEHIVLPEKRKEADRVEQDSASSEESPTSRASFTFKWEAGDYRVTKSVSDGNESTDVSYRRLPETKSVKETGGIGTVNFIHQDEATCQGPQRTEAANGCGSQSRISGAVNQTARRQGTQAGGPGAQVTQTVWLAGIIKFKTPPPFSGKSEEDAADSMERYETTAD